MHAPGGGAQGDTPVGREGGALGFKGTGEGHRQHALPHESAQTVSFPGAYSELPIGLHTTHSAAPAGSTGAERVTS